MASDESTVAGSGLSIQELVFKFYCALQCPQIASQFYQETSKVGRPGLDGVMESITPQQAINEKDMHELVEGAEAVVVQGSCNCGVIVLVTGSLERDDLARRYFAHSLLLATQVEGGFFVLNDLLRYVDETDNQLASGAVAPLSFEQDRLRGFPPLQSRSAKRKKKGRPSRGSNSTRVFVQASSTASNQSTIVRSQTPAQVVGNAFVRQFYHIICQSPQLAYQFYHEESMLGRWVPDYSMKSLIKMQAINEKILEMDYGEHRAEVKTVDVQESLDCGMTVLVTGHLTGKDLVKKCFAQAFFLAPQNNGFFVLTDIFINMGELQKSRNPSPDLGEATAHNQVHHNSYAEALLAPPSSSITEESQLAMAISASIQSAMEEGVLIDLDELDINSNTKTDHSKYGSSSNTTTTTSSCVICLDARVEGACIPCGHMAGCMHCLNVIKNKKWGCPVCRATVDQVVKIYCI